MYSGDNYTPTYYRPYTSDDEEDSGDEGASSITGISGGTETTDSSSTSSIDYGAPKALVRAAGISWSNDTQQLRYDTGFKYDGRFVSYGAFDYKTAAAATASARASAITSNTPFMDYGGTKMETKAVAANSLIVMNSRDRDRQVYPQPTAVTLRLPRVYKNITAIQFNQIKLLSAFYYFRPEKGNTTFYLQETGRTPPSSTVIAGAPSNGFPITIESGSYDINSLLTQLNMKMNMYPIFYYFPNGFADFIPSFRVAGDLGVNFNQVGDYYYDILNAAYITPPKLTLTYVVQGFFVTRFPNQTSYSPTELLAAYYYPPLKLYLLQNLSLATLPSPSSSVPYVAGTPFFVGQVNLTLTTSAGDLLPEETPLTRVLYTSQGLADPVVAEVISNNTFFLDDFRTLNTFKNTPVNKYVASVDTTQNIVTFTSPNLNTSLTTMIQTQYSNSFLNELADRGVTQTDFATSNALLQQNNAVLLSMYGAIQTALQTTFAVPYSTYSLSYLANSSNPIYIQNNTHLSNQTVSAETPISNYSLQVDPPLGAWSIPAATLSNAPNYINSNIVFNTFFDITTNLPTTTPLLNATTSNIFTNPVTLSADCVVPVAAEQYTIFTITSPVRQTLQVETLPRPVKYRYPAYNSNNYSSSIRTLFNYTYNFLDNSNFDATLPSDYVMEGGGSWSSLMISLQTTFGSIPTTFAANTISATTVLGALFYTFTAPTVTSPPANSVNKYPIQVSFSSSSSSSPFTAIMYHDRAALMADVHNLYKENSNNFKMNVTSTTGQSNVITLTWNVYEQNTYYILVRPASVPFSAFSVTPTFAYPSGTSYTSFTTTVSPTFDPTIDPTSHNFYSNFNYAQVYDPDWIRLPISNAHLGPVIYIPTSNQSLPPPSIGYDINGNSFDLTDYRPFSLYTRQTTINPNYNFDPIGSNSDLFNYISPYSTTFQSYFYTGSSNYLSSGSNQTAITSPSTYPTSRQYKLLNWQDGTYLGTTPTLLTTSNILSNINPTFYKVPFSRASTNSNAIAGYTYDVSSNLSVEGGVCGFIILPNTGVWNLTEITFTSAVMNKSNNSNHNIAAIGIFNTASISGIATSNIALSNALLTLPFSRRIYYLPSQSNNPSFLAEYTASPQEYVFNSPNVAYGSYYTFKVASNISTPVLTGYSENAGSFLNTSVGFYSAIAFGSNGSILPITQLAGSLLPNPIATTPVVSDSYVDGNTTPNGRQLIVPSITTPSYTQVAYERSMPYTTTAFHMISTSNSLDTAWQIFYPAFKAIFIQASASASTSAQNPITNTSNILPPPEYFHTNMFVYNNFTSFSNDILGPTWGLESPSNYLCADTQFSGYQYNSYISNVPMEANKTYYIAIRGYTPSEQFETMVRFMLPNRYDFGWVTLTSIATEAAYVTSYETSNSGAIPPNFNPAYANTLATYNNIFVGNCNYGGYTNVLPCFSGISSNPFYPAGSNPYNPGVASNGWGGAADVYATFINLYAQQLPVSALVNGVNAAALGGVSNFIASQLPGILPTPTSSTTQATAPLLYSILFGSGNNYATSNLPEEWGLGWNLGFPKTDTPLLTRHSGTSFYKILDDYIYVKLNPEYPINCLDTTGPENLQVTRESTGSVGGYNMKLLLNTFGGYAQTAILNPVVLNPPIGSMDRLTLQLLDLNGNPISNSDCEWNGCLQITEAMDQPTQDSAIPKAGVIQDISGISS